MAYNTAENIEKLVAEWTSNSAGKDGILWGVGTE